MDLIAALHLPQISGLALGLILAALALAVSARNKISARTLIFASGVGFAVATGWVLTFTLAQVAFEPVAVTSATFSGPSANTLMFLLTPNPVLEFDVGLIPGVFLGAFLSAITAHEFKFEGFDTAGNMRRAMIGAVLMGFGAMLAGGCAIGAGVTGGSIFAGTAWLALFCMWIGAMITDFVIDQSPHPVTAKSGA
jgi:uncharacterized membrane protein YedE/YeeE